MDEIILLILGAVINGVMLMVGLYLGTRQSAKELRRELEDILAKSELVSMLKKTLTDQTLIEKATRFFEEATALVSSPEAKNFFKNVTALMKDLSAEETESVLKLPKKKSPR